MSYIHKALKKAQRQKDGQSRQYEGVLAGQRKLPSRFAGSTLWWIFIVVIVSLLAFASYSWFDSSDKQTLEAKKVEPEKPVTTPVRKKPAAAPVRKSVVKDRTGTDAKGLYDRARLFHKNGRLNNAKRLYQETLKVDPNWVDAMNNLGVIYLQAKNYEAARKNFENAIRIKPEHVDPYYNLSCVYALMGKTKPAIAHLKRAGSIDREAIKWAREDADLNNLRGIPEFEEIIKH